MKEKRLLVDYMITSRCNLSCPFCYGPSKLHTDLSYEQKIQLADWFAQFNAKFIITGGEPLSCTHIVDFCKYINDKGLKIALQTNGIYTETLQKILCYLDWIALPLDAISNESSHKLRGIANNLHSTSKAITIVDDYNNKHNQKIKIKVGTVLTKINGSEIIDIYKILSEYHIDFWKLYTLQKRGKAANDDIFNLLKLSDNIEQNIIKEVTRTPSKFPIHYSDPAIVRLYLFITPNGEIILIKGEDKCSYGNIFDSKGNINSTNALKAVRDYYEYQDDNIIHFLSWDENCAM